MKTFFAGAAFAGAAMSMLAVTAAMAQSSTTHTQSKTTTTTTTSKWQTPDGTRSGSTSHTRSNTQSKSVTVGRPAPSQHGGIRPAAAVPHYGAGLAGGWSVSVAGSRPCMLSIYQSSNTQGGGATTSGCASRDMQAVGNWIMQGGHTLTLTKGLVSTVATLRRTGHGRFEGTTSNGEPIVVWR